MKTTRFIACIVALCIGTLGLMAKAKTERVGSAIPASWNMTADTLFVHQQPIDEQWWLRFNDAELNRLVDLSLQNNYDLAQAAYRIQKAKAAMRVAEGGYYPSISVGSTYDYNQAYDNNPDLGRRGSFDLSMKWEIDIIGAVRNRAQSQKHAYLASQDEYNAVVTSLVANTVSAYVALREAQWRLDVVRENMKSQLETVEITEARFNSGLVSALDVAQAKSIYYATEAQVPLHESAVVEAINTLGVLTGQVPWVLQPELEHFSFEEEPNTEFIVSVSFPAEILRQRPDVRAAEKMIDAKASMVGATISDWLPKFFVTGRFGYGSADYQQLFQEQNMYWMVAPSVQWNIFSGTTLSGNIQSAKADLEQTINAYNQTVLNALQEVDDAMNGYRHSTQHSSASKLALDQARVTKDLALDLYKRGLIDFQSVLDAQRDMLHYADNYVVAKSSVLQSLVQLYLALGGEWQPIEK